MLEEVQGVPWTTYAGSADDIHCVVSQTNAAGGVRKLVPSDLGGLLTFEMQLEDYQFSILGCEFRHTYALDLVALPANPQCLYEVTSQRLDMSQPGHPYRVELVHCAGQPGPKKLELFGADPSVPLAVAAPPSVPGPDQTCLVLEAQVAAPSVGRLVFCSSTSFNTKLLFY